MVLGHSDGCSLFFLLELFQSLRELRGVTSAKGFELRFNRDQCLGPKREGIRCFLGRKFWSCVVDLECYR